MNECLFTICFFDAIIIYYKLKYIFGMFYNKVYFIFYSVKPTQFQTLLIFKFYLKI